LPFRQHILDVERVPLEALGETLDLVLPERVEVDPGEAGGVELSGARLLARDDGTGLAPAHLAPDAGQARHRY
jgi:hypothetical protein